MPKKPEHSVKAILQAIKNSGGIKQKVAENLGVHRHTVTRYVLKYPTVQQALQDELDRVLDKAEGNIFHKVSDGDILVSQWILRYKAKDRGYVEKTEQKIEGTVETIIKVHYEGEEK
jgi:transposase